MDFLTDLLVVFALGGVVVYALRRLRVPPIVGLLIAGAVMGPHGLSLVADVHRVEILAEIGVVLLLFTIGLEFSLAKLLRMWKAIVGAGGGQVLLTIVIVALATLWLGEGVRKSVFFGFLAAMSSTAIVLRLLAEQAQLNAPAGRLSLAVLLFQDLCIVPLMLLTPFVAGRGDGLADVGLTLLKAAAVVVGVLLAARRLVPPILHRVVGERSRELFLTFTLVLCLGTAWVTSLVGLSLALGAFLAGLAISESEYSHQALAEAIPFRDAFGSLFFVSIGMLLDAAFLLRELPLVALVVVILIVIKTAAVALPVALLGYPLRIALRTGLALAQVGEFAFVLSRVGIEHELISQLEYQVFLSASVISMVITPALLFAGKTLVDRLPDSGASKLRRQLEPDAGDEHHKPLHEHVIIAGYGVNGQNVSRALSGVGIDYTILEMNPETVRSARQRGEPIHYGDCTRAAVLESLSIAQARLFVVAISDAASTRQAVSLARSLNPDIYILVRTRFVAEVEELKKLGADEVIPEEFETSIEIFARVLHRFDVPRNVILSQVSQVRDGLYEMFRAPTRETRGTFHRLPGMDSMHIESALLAGDSPALGKSLAELDLRQKTGISVVAVQRNETSIPNPAADFRFVQGDVVWLFGDREALDAALAFLDPNVTVA